VTLERRVPITVGGVYRPPAFVEDDPAAVVALARQAGFGHLVVVADERPVSTPMPFIVSDDGVTVRGHLARPNPVWRSAPCNALLIVPVTDAYISPSWYPAKAEHGKVVPTWNYEIVHIHGGLLAHDDVVWVEHLVRDLTDLNESALPEQWSVDDAPADYLAKMLRGIVGVELLVESLVGKRKLSQNRPAEDQAGVVAGLDATRGRGAASIADAMRTPSR
jgi:transcriptional regulator